MTCWRRLGGWNEAGVGQRLHEALSAELNAAGKPDWSRTVIDSSHTRAMRRLRVRWESRDDMHEAFLGLAAA